MKPDPIKLCQHCRCRLATRYGVYSQLWTWNLCGRCCDVLRASVTLLRCGRNPITQLKTWRVENN